MTLERVLQEKKVFDLSVNFEKFSIEDGSREWNKHAPGVSHTVALPTAANILGASIESLTIEEQLSNSSVLCASTADRHLYMASPTDTERIISSGSNLQDSPILTYSSWDNRHMLCGSMSGKVILYNTSTNQICDERRDHSKYVVKVATWSANDKVLIATAGWDSKVFLYAPSEAEVMKLGEPIASLVLPTNPEALLFVSHPDLSGEPMLLVARRDSTFLYYYRLPQSPGNTLHLLGKQNLAPHSNAWIAFTPSSVAMCPMDASLLAVATSAVPHMKIIIVRVLYPLLEDDPSIEATLAPAAIPEAPVSILDAADPLRPSPASQARAALALQDREDAAILINCSTMAPQTPYSTPVVVWRPDGTGVWVNSDDGVIRGIEARTGKVVAKLEGHEAGSKIRCLWSGMVQSENSETREEWLISGGFDQKLIIWKPKTM